MVGEWRVVIFCISFTVSRDVPIIVVAPSHILFTVECLVTELGTVVYHDRLGRVFHAPG